MVTIVSTHFLLLLSTQLDQLEPKSFFLDISISYYFWGIV